MHGLITRDIVNTITKRLDNNPAVALLGARQVGKSTIAKMIMQYRHDTIYLDLERPSDLNKLNDPEAFFSQFQEHLICFDEIQRKPEIFPVLRSFIDQNQRNGQFLILGSASRDLIRQSSESLAGRLTFIEITPFIQHEVSEIELTEHWLKGGYPRSLLQTDPEHSLLWREDYIRSF